MTCWKITFNSKGEAEKHARVNLRPRKGQPVKRLHPYQCRKCGQFHLTSQEKRR